YSKTLFKKGMCYFNLRDYSQSKYYLTLSYEKSPSGSVADDSLYYLGRALTNLNLDNDAISYYQKLLQLFPTSNYSDDALYRMGRIYSLKEDFKNAASYFQKVSSDYPGGDKLPDALWELGLIQYRSGDYNSAKNTFSNYASSYKGGSLEEKGLFWQAKCCQKLGENDKAADLYKKIVNLNSYSYYTFASDKMLAEMNEEVQIKEINTQLNPENPQIADIIPDIYDILEEDSYIETGEINHINKAIELLKLEFFNSASLEIEAGSSEIEENPVRTLEIATLYMKSNNYANSIKIISKNFSRLKSGLNEPYTDYLYYLYYPYGYKELVKKYSSQYNLDPLFTLAVIRQESLFEPDARSPADAQGLMQIWPPTGEYIANKMGIPNYNINLLLDPDINIRMGTYYLRQQLDNFGQNKFYCVGAYNGGPTAMSRWISGQGNMAIDEFIENISKGETREYIKIVMGNYYFYQMLYD
ncbi:MAG: transglycosylase SLT domain-containing protein, partial [Actinobacteria bacterium]|nr:transglycosylase SLT domain-containing protein [Actinomycetota bacterium]